MLLSSATYGEVAEDNDATIDAAFLVLIYILAATLPTAMNANYSWILIGVSIPLVLLGWLLNTGLIYFISSGIFHGEGSLPGLFRALGFSYSAGIFYVLTIIPGVGLIISGLLSLYIAVANIRAIGAAMKIGFWGTIVSIILASISVSLLIGCLMVPVIFLLGPENLINSLEQLR